MLPSVEVSIYREEVARPLVYVEVHTGRRSPKTGRSIRRTFHQWKTVLNAKAIAKAIFEEAGYKIQAADRANVGRKRAEILFLVYEEESEKVIARFPQARHSSPDEPGGSKRVIVPDGHATCYAYGMSGTVAVGSWGVELNGLTIAQVEAIMAVVYPVVEA